MSAQAGTSSFEQESEMLPRGLPPFAARGLALLLSALFIAVVVVAIFVHFPETVHATFVLVPERGSNPVTSPRRGIVESVNIEDAKEVQAGDLLYTIRSDELRIISTEMTTLQKEVTSTNERLRELENENKARAAGDAAAQGEFAARIKRLENERDELGSKDVALDERFRISMNNLRERVKGADAETVVERRRIELVKTLQAKAESSYKSGVITEWDMLRERYSYQLADLELVRADRRAIEAQAALSEMEASRAVQFHERLLEKVKLTGEIAEATASLNRLKRESESREILAQDRTRQFTAIVTKSTVQIESMSRELRGSDDGLLKITAPYSGTVVKVGTLRAGEVIERGTTLCELAAAGEKLVAELSISEKDAGLVAKGQKVKLLFAAYPYTRFGARAGTLNWISPTAGAKGAFRAMALVEDRGVVLHGIERSFNAGMGGQVRILSGERTLIEFVFEPLRQLKENLMR